MNTSDIAAIIEFKKSLSAYELGAIEALEFSKKESDWHSNPYEPGFTEYDHFTEGWTAVRDGNIDVTAPTLKARFEAAKSGRR
jgi:hypothetical protein